MTASVDILDQRVVLVTGAASGIGRAIAYAFAGAGARVVVIDVLEAAGEVADEIEGRFVRADLSDTAGIKEICKRVIELEGRVDILVNNAGLQHVAPVDEFPDEKWEGLIKILLVAPFHLTKQLVPGMKERGWGRIINISSIHGLVASPYKSAYVSAKHGLVGLTKSVALEVGEYGITVNAICPSYCRTPLVEAQIKSQAQTQGIDVTDVVDKVMLAPAAIKRLIEPDEVAELALFLASDKARSITGATHQIDAGWTAR